MSGHTNEQKQPGLWDEEASSTASAGDPRRDQSRVTQAATDTPPTARPHPRSTAPPSAPATHPDFEETGLWDADRVAAYLGVPKQTLYAWRHSGKGPKGFRVGKHLRWHAHTVVEWTLALERDQ